TTYSPARTSSPCVPATACTGSTAWPRWGCRSRSGTTSTPTSTAPRPRKPGSPGWTACSPDHLALAVPQPRDGVRPATRGHAQTCRQAAWARNPARRTGRGYAPSPGSPWDRTLRSGVQGRQDVLGELGDPLLQPPVGQLPCTLTQGVQRDPDEQVLPLDEDVGAGRTVSRAAHVAPGIAELVGAVVPGEVADLEGGVEVPLGAFGSGRAEIELRARIPVDRHVDRGFPGASTVVAYPLPGLVRQPQRRPARAVVRVAGLGGRLIP